MKDNALFVPKIKKKAWENYSDFKEMRSDQVNVEYMSDKILTVAHSRVDMAACICLIYLTGSRISEIIPWHYRSKYKKDAIELGYNINKPGFELQQLSFYKDFNSNIWWNFKTINLKQNSKKPGEQIDIRERLKKIQATKYKEIRLPAFGDLPDLKLIKFLDMFFENVLCVYRDDFDEVIKKAKPDSFINPFKEAELHTAPFSKFIHHTVYHYVKNFLNMSPHNLRELRMQHLLRYYKFEIQEIHLAGGWSSKSSMALTYTRSKITDMQRKFTEAIAANPL